MSEFREGGSDGRPLIDAETFQSMQDLLRRVTTSGKINLDCVLPTKDITTRARIGSIKQTFHTMVDPRRGPVHRADNEANRACHQTATTLGLAVGKILYPQVKTVEHAMIHLNQGISLASLPNTMPDESQREAAARLIMDWGYQGLHLDDQLGVLADGVADSVSNDVRHVIYSKAGFGLGIWIYHKAQRMQLFAEAQLAVLGAAAAREDILKTAERITSATEDEWTAAMAGLMGPEPNEP
jgi:hypothetical protein